MVLRFTIFQKWSPGIFSEFITKLLLVCKSLYITAIEENITVKISVLCICWYENQLSISVLSVIFLYFLNLQAKEYLIF